jgi:hypothetical protein
MRVISFILYFSFLLIGCGSYSYAGAYASDNANTSFQNFAHKRQIKPTIEDQSIVVIEDSDVDIEDDCFANENSNDNCKTNFSIVKYYLMNTMYSLNNRHFVLFDFQGSIHVPFIFPKKL